MMNMVSWKLTLVRDPAHKLRSDRTVKAALIAATPTAELRNCHPIRRVSTFASEFDTKNRKVSGVFFAYFNVHTR